MCVLCVCVYVCVCVCVCVRVAYVRACLCVYVRVRCCCSSTLQPCCCSSNSKVDKQAARRSEELAERCEERLRALDGWEETMRRVEEQLARSTEQAIS